jgi:hypothetical protein
MTVVELVTASTILLTCLVSLSTLLTGVIAGSETTQMRDKATNIANQRLEAARNLPFDDVGVRYSNGLSGNPAGTILTPDTANGFTVDTDCTWVRTSTGRAAYKKLVVTVSWSSPIPSHVELTTMIVGHSEVQTSGDILIRLRYREDASPVIGVPVVLQTSDAHSTGVFSDSAGEAFFGQAAVGSANVTVTPPVGYVVDTSSMTSMTVAADSLSTYIVYVQRPAQVTFCATDMAGAALPGATVTVTSPDGTPIGTAVTDASGNAQFTGLFYGQYSAAISTPGYASVTQPFSATTDSQSQTVPFRMSPAPATGLRVRVFDSNGTQLPGATVALRLNGTVAGSGSTGTNGEIAFTPAPGSYQVTVDDAPNYLSQVKTDSVAAGDSHVLDFYLSVATHGGNMHVITEDRNNNPQSLRTVVSGLGYYRDDLYSDSDGVLWLSNLAPGSYTVRTYSKPSSTVTVLVASDQTVAVTVNKK